MKCNYTLEGEGEKTIIFIHGLSDSLQYWEVLSLKLSKDYQILRYDLRGHGESEFSPFTMDDLAEDLYELTTKLNIKKASLAGLSYPEIVENLIIMSSFSEVDENLRSKFLEFRDAINIGFKEFFDSIIKYVLPEDIIDENYELLQANRDFLAQKANPDGIKQGIEIGMKFNVTDELKNIKVPALILAGRDDEISTNDLQHILNDNIDDSRLIFFENTKHNILIGENVSVIEKLIRQLL